MLYEAGWINLNFDWAAWVQSPEGQKLVISKEAIASANCEDLGMLLTTLVRNDRFCEGSLAKAFSDKILLAIAERAEALLNGTDEVSAG